MPPPRALNFSSTTALRTDLSFFALCIIGLSQFWLNMAGQETKVHRRVIPMIFPMIQRAKNDRLVREQVTCLRQCQKRENLCKLGKAQL